MKTPLPLLALLLMTSGVVAQSSPPAVAPSAANQQFATAPLQAESKAARLFDQASRNKTTRLEEVQLPDGRRMTQVHGSKGTYCVYKESVNLTKGRDQLTSGVRTMTTTCP